MSQLQTIVDKLAPFVETDDGCVNVEIMNAMAIINQMMQAEPSCPDCKAPDLLYECIHCSASNYPPEPKVPAGFALVPVEPTPEMISAGRTTPMPSDSEFDEDDDYRAVYKAMCAAAPKVTE
jgi:hypothetical protein